MKRTSLLIFLAMAITLFVAPTELFACDGCKSAIASTTRGPINLSEGMGYSIYFMLSMPFLIFSSFAAYFYFKFRKAKGSK